MENFLTFILLVITGLMWWQSIFNNNVVLFKERLKVYRQFLVSYNRYLNLSEQFIDLSIEKPIGRINAEILSNAIQDKRIVLLNELSVLKAVISEMKLMDFSSEVTKKLDDIKTISIKILDYFIGERESIEPISEDECYNASKQLKDYISKGSSLEKLLQKEVTLRNFKYYRRKICSKLCCKNWCPIK